MQFKTSKNKIYLYFIIIISTPQLLLANNYSYIGSINQPEFNSSKNSNPYISNYGPLYNTQYQSPPKNLKPFQIDIQGQNAGAGFYYTGLSKNITF